jgi:hypothetical protein
MVKDSRRKKAYRKNASKLHKAVGNMLHASPIFSNYRIYQEYPVNMVSPYFDSGREKFDWVIMDLMVVIECHGQQHYKPVRFGGMSQEEAEVKFVQQIRRDMAKKDAARKAGWTYVVFKYDEDVDVNSLMAKITAQDNVAEDRGVSGQDRNVVSQQVKQKKKPKQNEDYHKEQLKRAREYRKQRYRKQKEQQDGAKRRKK